MADTTRYMRVELPTDYEKTERVTVYGMNNTEIEVSSDLLVTADEIPREGEGYTVEEYRKALSEIYNMGSTEREKAFGVDESIYEYLKNFSATELMEKYRIYKNAPKVGEYWKNNDGQVIIVRYIKNNIVYYYYCSNGVSSYMLTCNFVKIFTKTGHESQYLEAFLSEMEEVSK